MQRLRCNTILKGRTGLNCSNLVEYDGMISRLGLMMCFMALVLTGCQTAKVATTSQYADPGSEKPVATGEIEAGLTSIESLLRPAPEPEKKAEAKPRKKSRKLNTVAAGRVKYGPIIAKHAKAHGVPVKLAMAVVEVESSYRPNARGRAGEIGLMQLLPKTARFIGYKGTMRNLYRPDVNIAYGMKYLGKAHRLGGGSLCGTILKYNAGHGAKRMNPISREYCRRIKRLMRK